MLVCSVPLTKEHLEALNAYVFQRVPIEEVGLVPAALEWVKLEVDLGTAQKRYVVLKKWKDDRDDQATLRLLQQEGEPLRLSYCVVILVVVTVSHFT